MTKEHVRTLVDATRKVERLHVQIRHVAKKLAMLHHQLRRAKKERDDLARDMGDWRPPTQVTLDGHVEAPDDDAPF